MKKLINIKVNIFFKKRHISWLDGKMAQWLEALVALLEDSGLILSIPMTAHSYL